MTTEQQAQLETEAPIWKPDDAPEPEAPEPSEANDVDGEAERRADQRNDPEYQRKLEEAKRYGYRDPDEWQGEPPARGFMSLDEYLESGPYAKARLAEVEKRLDRSERDIEARVEERFQRLSRAQQAALRMQRDRIEDDYVAAEDEAAANGDVQLLRRLREQKRQSLEAFDKTVATEDAAQPRVAPEDQRAFDAWKANGNTWVDDPAMRPIAQAALAELGQDPAYVGAPRSVQLERLGQRVREMVPGRFSDGATSPPPPTSPTSPPAPIVETNGRRAPGQQAKERGYETLPREAKEQFGRLNKMDPKTFPATKEAREKYAHSYWSNE